VAAASLLLAGGGVGGAVAYASVDAEFRKLLEDSVPGSDQVLELLIGAPEPPPPPPKPLVSKLKIPSSVVVTKPKKDEPPMPPLEPPPPPAVLEESAPAKEAEPAITNEPEPAEVPEVVTPEPVAVVEAAPVEPVVEAPAAPEETPKATEDVAVAEEKVVAAPEPSVVEAAAAVVEEPVAQEIPKIEGAAAIVEEPAAADVAVETAVEAEAETAVEAAADTAVEAVVATAVEAAVELPVWDIENTSLEVGENTSMETVLGELCKDMKATVDSAVVGYEASSDAVLGHINVMQKVLEANLTTKDDNAWNEMFEAAVTKSDAVKAAEIREREAMAAIDNVIESIAAGRKNRVTSTNPQLLVAEEAANQAIYQLDQAKVRISAVQGEAKVMEEYRELVEAGRQQFQKEMASIMPDVKLGEKSGKLTEDELNMFISHAYRKVLFLQQELAKQQTLEQDRFKKALEKQRMETQIGASEKMELELERQKRDLELEHERRMAAIRDEAEVEMRAQLRRQAAAHSDHLADVLSVQATELTRKNVHILDEQMAGARSEYLTSLAGLSATVTGLSEALTARAGDDVAALRAQGLWLACTGLKASVAAGRTAADTWEGRLLPLGGPVATVVTAAGAQDSFVASVVGSLSPVAVERGVYTEDSLRERWHGVERVARRVAAIGEEGGSLLSYGLSYLQSVLLVDLTTRLPSEGEAAIDAGELSATDLVNLARHSLDRGNLARAVQYVTLLRGESGRAARDWLAEARLTLEAGQAAEALVAHAAAAGVAALPAQ